MGNHGCNADGLLNDDDFTGPLPIIGVYITGASLVCFLLMFLDLLYGFRGIIPWFPSKFFALNSATLTLISIATKLPVDLNTSMPSREDQLSKLSGTVMICTMMANFMPSLGAMGDSELCSNFIAVALLVITVAVNVCIQISTGVIYVFLPEHVIVLLFMLLLLLLLGLSASTVPNARQILNAQYDWIWDGNTDHAPSGSITEAFKRMKALLEMSSIMAHSRSPKHLLRSSETCNGAGVFSLLSALVLVEALFRSFLISGSMSFCKGTSDYGWSTWVILTCQSLVVVLSIISPVLRWLNAIKMKRGGGQSLSQLVLTVDDFGVTRFVEGRRSPLPFYIPCRLGRRIFVCLKNFIMSLLIATQRVAVLVSKFPALVVVPLLLLVTLTKTFCKKFATDPIPSTGLDDESRAYNRLNYLVLHLDGEKDLVQPIFKMGFKAVSKWISKGRNNKPEDLIKLLEEKSTPSEGFKYAIEFDSDAVSSLFEQILEHDFSYKCSRGDGNDEITKKAPNCWALPIATLTSIAISLPYSDQQRMNLLLQGVSQGLEFVRFIEKNIYRTRLMNLRKAAEDVWLSVDPWLDIDLRNFALNNHNASDSMAPIIEEMINKSFQNVEKDVLKFKEDMSRRFLPDEWPTEVVAANSMYRICKTILLDPEKSMDNLINWLEKTVSDLLGDCLLNLPIAVFNACKDGRAEDTEAQIRNAALMFGAAQHLQQLLRQSTRANSRLYATKFSHVFHYVPHT